MPGSQVNTLYPTGGVANLETGLFQDLPAPRRACLARKTPAKSQEDRS